MIDKQYVMKLWEESRRAAKTDKQAGGASGSTFLYIRAFATDNGIGGGNIRRPWMRRPGPFPLNSLDIQILDQNCSPVNFSLVKVNNSYIVRVSVSNEGDLDCNCCTVDLFIAPPFAPSPRPNFTKSKLLGEKNVNVNAHSRTDVDFPIYVDSTMTTCKVFLARVYSLINNDYPVDWISGCMNEDRHIGEHYVIIS